jgi:hypothetical protein
MHRPTFTVNVTEHSVPVPFSDIWFAISAGVLKYPLSHAASL